MRSLTPSFLLLLAVAACGGGEPNELAPSSRAGALTASNRPSSGPPTPTPGVLSAASLLRSTESSWWLMRSRRNERNAKYVATPATNPPLSRLMKMGLLPLVLRMNNCCAGNTARLED